MKSSIKNKISAISRLAASLMVLVFLSIPILQAAHKHGGESSAKHASSETVVYSKCPTCEFLVHKQQKHSFGGEAPILIHFSQKPAVVYFSLNCKIYPASIQGFTNKGPPVIS
jgi:hypothetical protein